MEKTGPGGFEPPSTGPKPVILSRLNYGPVYLSRQWWMLIKLTTVAVRVSLRFEAQALTRI